MVKSQSETITLDDPIVRGTTTITELTIRRPRAGELRGISMLAIMHMQTEALFTLIPRICEPVLTPAEMNQLDTADLVQIGSAMAVFTVPKHLRTGLEEEVSGKTPQS